MDSKKNVFKKNGFQKKKKKQGGWVKAEYDKEGICFFYEQEKGHSEAPGKRKNCTNKN